MDDDFVTPKKIKLDEENNENAVECTICYEPCTSSGPHQLCALKCGHLMGYSCIEKWYLKEKKNAKCPLCQQPVQMRQVVRLFAANTVVLDARERDEAYLKMEQAQQQRDQMLKSNQELQKENSRLLLQMQILKDQLQELKEEKVKLKQQLARTAFKEEKKTMIKAMTFNRSNMVCGTSNDQQHGFTRISIETKHTSFYPVHTHEIRDIHSSNDLLVSTSLDKTLVLTDARSDTKTHTYLLNGFGWSCQFDPLQPHLIYCGTHANQLVQFDIRITDKPSKIVDIPFRKGKGIHALLHCDQDLLVGTFDGIYDTQANLIQEGDGVLTCIDYDDGYLLSCWKEGQGTAIVQQLDTKQITKSISYPIEPGPLMARSRIQDSILYLARYGIHSHLETKAHGFFKGMHRDKPLVAGVYDDLVRLWHT
ncbi:hypothetical protein EDD86DRAFT_278726 [Gorgonomyces haynaldii]|nr:hypothetical protein EDD86DRAFT_278726 [Gorgonomyces haynaldii]